MRREIARELKNSSNEVYTVDQESVTADEKETDIRLRALSGQQGTISSSSAKTGQVASYATRSKINSLPDTWRLKAADLAAFSSL